MKNVGRPTQSLCPEEPFKRSTTEPYQECSKSEGGVGRCSNYSMFAKNLPFQLSNSKKIESSVQNNETLNSHYLTLNTNEGKYTEGADTDNIMRSFDTNMHDKRLVFFKSFCL